MAMASGALGALTFFVFVFTAQSEVQLLQKHVHKVTQSSDLSHQEVFADATLYQVMSSCGGPISKTCWDKKFDGFDRNGDGVISAEDLQRHERALGASPGGNFTREELRAGLALAARWFPHQAARFIAHGPLITELLMQGPVDLSQVPVPPDPLAKVPLPVLRASLEANITTLTRPECVAKLLEVTGSSVLLIFNILGVTLPSGSLVAELLESRSARVLDRIAPVLKPHGSDEKSIAMKVWQVFNILHEEGIFSEILEADLKQVNWWEASLIIVRVGATVASWYASGTALLLLQLGLAIPSCAELISGVKEVPGVCS